MSKSEQCVALVLGAAQGIWAAVADEPATDGMKVVIVDSTSTMRSVGGSVADAVFRAVYTEIAARVPKTRTTAIESGIILAR